MARPASAPECDHRGTGLGQAGQESGHLGTDSRFRASPAYTSVCRRNTRPVPCSLFPQPLQYIAEHVAAQGRLPRVVRILQDLDLRPGIADHPAARCARTLGRQRPRHHRASPRRGFRELGRYLPGREWWIWDRQSSFAGQTSETGARNSGARRRTYRSSPQCLA